jgi:hypothetical protein
MSARHTAKASGDAPSKFSRDPDSSDPGSRTRWISTLEPGSRSLLESLSFIVRRRIKPPIVIGRE